MFIWLLLLLLLLLLRWPIKSSSVLQSRLAGLAMKFWRFYDCGTGGGVFRHWRLMMVFIKDVAATNYINSNCRSNCRSSSAASKTAIQDDGGKWPPTQKQQQHCYYTEGTTCQTHTHTPTPTHRGGDPHTYTQVKCTCIAEDVRMCTYVFKTSIRIE